jgi:hypothetical protein
MKYFQTRFYLMLDSPALCHINVGKSDDIAIVKAVYYYLKFALKFVVFGFSIWV